MIVFYLTIPFMLIGIGIAVGPLLWAMRHQLAWDDSAEANRHPITSAEPTAAKISAENPRSLSGASRPMRDRRPGPQVAVARSEKVLA